MNPELDQIELAWAAGFVDGEGCFYCLAGEYPTLAFVITQVDPRPLKRFILANELGWLRGPLHPPSRKASWSPFYEVRYSGRRALALTEILTPYLSEPKKEQIAKALDRVALGPI